MIPWLGIDDPFPPVHTALREPDGLLAAGADLSLPRLLDAYRQGIFPWYSEEDPLLWWSPDPRMVLWLGEFHLSRSLRRVLHASRFRVTLDTAFGAVMDGCAEPRGYDADDDAGTWITIELRAAYTGLAEAGHGHSVEVWDDELLVGGLYGVALGRMFYGESMFSRCANASKVALATLVAQLHRWEFELIDCQMSTSHLASLGAREIPRAEFVTHVARLGGQPAVPSPWRLDEDLSNPMRK